MITTTNAQEFFSELFAKADPYAYLSGLPHTDPPTIETEWLEFKGCERIDDKEIKSYWSEALSAFANTGGGVLVWGLDARKDENQIDRIIGQSVSPDAERLASRLRELLVQSVDPALPGVEIRTIRNGNAIDGYVVCLIPEGEAKAHRAEGAGRNYYIRIGTSFVIPPVSLLRGLFFPMSSVRLIPSIVITPLDAQRIVFRFALRNDGTLSAYQTFVLFEYSSGIFLPEDVKGVRHGEANRNRLTFELDRPLHPKADGFVLANMITNLQVLPKYLTLRLFISCKDTSMKKWSCVVDCDDLANPISFLAET